MHRRRLHTLIAAPNGMSEGAGSCQGRVGGWAGVVGVAGWVRARAGEGVGVKVERPQRSEDERP